ncbi:MAG TPA: PIN domain nuclease [Nocardioidaceae bacterium]|nr:PIN domain nuclease [Nocardioidaceae bacterium]
MRLLIDTSAWVDYLRGAPTPTTDAVRKHLLAKDTEVVTCEPVALELLAGAGDESRARKLETLMNGLVSLSLDPWADFRDAARIYRTARTSGETIRSLTDCLIASIALNHTVTVLHRDRDFDVIARFTGLSVATTEVRR